MSLIEKTINSNFVQGLKRKLLLTTKIHVRIKRLRPNISPDLRLVKILNTTQINNIIDIGANKGQFDTSLLSFGFKGQIYSFEPLSKEHAVISKLSKNNPQWTIGERCAVGSSIGETTINICKDSVFSSILKTTKDHSEKKPGSTIIGSEKVPVLTVDEIVKQHSIDPKTTLLKIDTQGFEKQVMEGATNTIKHFKGLKIEIPLFPIYENTEWTFDEIYQFTKSVGFKPYSFEPEGVDPITGKMNTIDAIFIRV